MVNVVTRRMGSQQTQLTVIPTNRVPLDEAPLVPIKEGVSGRYGRCPIASLQPDPNSVRTHSKRQIKKLAQTIKGTGMNSPPVIDDHYRVLAGHARVEACKLLDMTEIPVIQILGASEAEKRVFSLADNRIAQDAGWDREKLAAQLPDLSKLVLNAKLSLDMFGFEVPELDALRADFAATPLNAIDNISEAILSAPRVLRKGDHLQLGSHSVMVGDARDAKVLEALLESTLVSAAVLDVPFNLASRDFGGRGRIKHEDFPVAAGEMSDEEYVAFLIETLQNAARVSKPGALHYVFIDWKHVSALLEAGRRVYNAYLNLIVWNKTNAGQGGLYRSQHELIGLFRVGEEQHRDNVQMGRFGNRSNVWTYPGANTFRRGRMEDLAAHPTVKPVQMVADAIKDCTQLGEAVLDLFAGSGTTLLAAEQVGRHAYVMEIEPKYADIIVRRWQAMTGRDAMHVESGLTFDALAAQRVSPR